MEIIFGVDIGGTNIKIGKFHDGKMIDSISIETNLVDSGSNIIDDACDTINKMHDKEKDIIIGLGFAVPGPVVNNVILGAHNLDWDEVDIRPIVARYFPNVPVVVLNDANAATIGEVNFLDGTQNAVMLTLGTGIGGGIIMNGMLITGANGSAGEIGHMKIVPTNGRECNCGLNGCFEQYASATGIVKTAMEMREGKKTLLNKIELSCKDIFEFAKYGDHVAKKVVDSYCYHLAIGCANIANIINPEVIILGGGVSKAGDFLLEKVQKMFYELAFYTARDTKIRLAFLGNKAGMYGGYYAVRMVLDI